MVINVHTFCRLEYPTSFNRVANQLKALESKRKNKKHLNVLWVEERTTFWILFLLNKC